MNKLKPILFPIILSVSFSLIGCSDNSQTKGTPSLFETEIEAEKAAKNFNCTGAHRMGDKWMPCKSHDSHEEEKNNKSNNGHHHHH
tara:strand:- start:175 stop:432 length:258 start_codon:yes stop_codon:yes gene_type:complete